MNCEHTFMSRLEDIFRWLSSKEYPCNERDAGDVGSVPGLGKLFGGGNGYPLQCSVWENPRDKGAWWTTVHGHRKETDTTELR